MSGAGMKSDNAGAILGKLDSVHPAKLLAGFLHARKTGVLVFRDGGSRIVIHLHDGCVVCDRSLVRRESGFHQYLSSKGVITPEELQRFSKRAHSSGSDFVELVLQNSIIDAPTVDRMAEEYYWKSAPNIFAWRRGEYSYRDRSVQPVGEAASREDGARFIAEGMIDKYDALTVRDRLSRRMGAKLKAVPGLLDAQRLSAALGMDAVWNAVRLGETPTGILGQNKKDRVRIMAYLYALLTLGVAKFQGDASNKPTRRSKSNDPFERLFAEASRSVDRIHSEVASQSHEVDVGLEGIDLEHVSPEQLEGKLKKLLEVKRQRLAMMGGEAGLRSPIGDAESGEDASEDETLAPGAGEEFDAAFGVSSAEDDTLAPVAADDIGFTDFKEDPTLLDNQGYQFDPEPEDGGEAFGDMDITLGGNVKFGPEDSVESIITALKSFCDEGRWEEAESAWGELNLRGYDGADAAAYAGWARYHSPGEDPFAAGAGLIQKAIQKAPKMDLPYVLMGRIYLEENDSGMAELYFVKAVEVNSDCFEAKEFIRKIYASR